MGAWQGGTAEGAPAAAVTSGGTSCRRTRLSAHALGGGQPLKSGGYPLMEADARPRGAAPMVPRGVAQSQAVVRLNVRVALLQVALHALLRLPVRQRKVAVAAGSKL